MTRRTKYEIWVEIMEFCLNKPQHQSGILRELRLTTEIVKQNLDYLKERELIEEIQQEEDKWVSYHTSKKGKEALNHFYILLKKFFTD